jgi:hypothetical protein
VPPAGALSPVPPGVTRQRRGVEFDSDDAPDTRELGVVSKQRRLSTPGDGSDHAVDHSARRDARGPAPAVDAHRAIEIRGGIEGEQFEAQQQAAEIELASVVTRAG